MFKHFKQWQIAMITSISVTTIVMGLNYTGIFQRLEWMVLDSFFRLRPSETPDQRIVIIAITENDIQKLGHYPINDHKLSQLLLKIKAQNPRVIGLDIVRDLAVYPGHQDLIKIYQSTPNLIGIEKVLGNKINPPPILAQKNQIAISDFVQDDDLTIRRALIMVQLDNQVKLSLGASLAFLYLEKEEISVETIDQEKYIFGLGKSIFKPFHDNDGGYIRADGRGYQILLNYRGSTCQNHAGNCPFTIVSLMDILEDKIPSNLMTDKIVLIGTFAESVADTFHTPYTLDSWTTFAGVEIHSHLASQIISEALDGRKNIKSFPQWLEILCFLILSGLGATIGLIIVKKSWTVIFLFIIIGILIYLSYYLFLMGWWLPIAFPLIGFISNVIAIVIKVLAYNLHSSYLQLEIYAQNLEKRVKERTKELHLAQEKSEKLILSILPFQIAQRLKDHTQIIADQFEEVTILFADIVGFTSLSSRLSPQELVYLLNRIFTQFDQLSLKNGLEKIKTIGDAYMVVAGLPTARNDHANAIAQMALEMQEIIKTFETSLNEPIKIRIGINTGTVVAGVIGLNKFIYDLWGDAVNIASRMESSGEAGKIQVTANTYEYLKDQFVLEERGIIKVKGKGEMLTYWLISQKIVET
jgi:adenylate cyclase